MLKQIFNYGHNKIKQDKIKKVPGIWKIMKENFVFLSPNEFQMKIVCAFSQKLQK